LDESKCLPIEPAFLLAVCNAVAASEKDTGNMAEGHWVSAGMSMVKHWLHPYLNGDAPLERSWRQSVRTNPYNFVLEQLRCCLLGTAEDVRGRVASPNGTFVRSLGKHKDQALSRQLSRLPTPALLGLLFLPAKGYNSYAPRRRMAQT
jgi:hypothetical protein